MTGIMRITTIAVDSCVANVAREIRKFHVVVVQRRRRNVQNSMMHVQSCCLLLLTYHFLPISLPSPSSLVLLSSRNSAAIEISRLNGFLI